MLPSNAVGRHRLVGRWWLAAATREKRGLNGVGIGRLCQVVDGARLHSSDGGRDIAVPSEHDDVNVRPEAAQDRHDMTIGGVEQRKWLAKAHPWSHIGAMLSRQSASAISVEDLTKRYDQILAIQGLTFDAAAGETTALLGGNGAGKTTTISILLGLLLPTSGRVTVLGEDMLRHRHRVLPRMNFSSPYIDLPRRLTVAENLRVYGHLYGLRRVEARLKELAVALDFTDMMKRPFGSLSSGQKTRVALAKSLLNQPELLLLDEPTASLDPDTADWVREYLHTYQRETGATILMASHNMSEVERMCHDVIILRVGHIVDRGTPQALIERYGRQTLEEVFLDIARGHGDERAGASAEAAQ